MASTAAPSAPSSSRTAPTARVSITAVAERRQRSITIARDFAPSTPPVAIANPGEVASIHCGEDAPALAWRLTSTTSLFSASAPTRASSAASAAASRSPASSIEPREAATRSTQCFPPEPDDQV
jgi:hypothetical protein